MVAQYPVASRNGTWQVVDKQRKDMVQHRHQGKENLSLGAYALIICRVDPYDRPDETSTALGQD